MGDSHMGLHARLMSQALRKLTGAVSRTNTCLVFINQIREKIGVMFGNPETTTGGMALKFYASVRLDIRRLEGIKQGGTTVGNRTRVTVKKNKMAAPFRMAEFDIMYNKGISKAGDVLDLGATMNIIEKRGAFYSFEGMRLGQGRENAKEFLENSPDVARRIEDAVRATAAMGPIASMIAPQPASEDDEEA
jgi:recombination protein RecA